MPRRAESESPTVKGGPPGPARRRRLLWVIAALTLAAGLAVWLILWPRLENAAREVEAMRSGLERQPGPPVRKPAMPGEAPLVLSGLQVARGIRADGKPLHPTKVLPIEDRDIYVFFEYAGAPEGASLTSDWYLNGRYQEVSTRPVPLPAGEGHGHLQLTVEESQKLPAGAYRVDVVYDDSVLGCVAFSVEEAVESQ